jgi:hypothetical protein
VDVKWLVGALSGCTVGSALIEKISALGRVRLLCRTSSKYMMRDGMVSEDDGLPVAVHAREPPPCAKWSHSTAG